MVSTRSKCRRCGTKFEGRGALCLSCLAHSPTMIESERKLASGKSRSKRVEGGPLCPYCRAELTWETMESSEIEVTIYVREKMYYCHSCRAVLGFSSWHTEG